ncbi:MAG: tetratricopeptide repeat protein, partial [Desulfobulbaceae bacterium]|nr:tetratricopeptide repeat protein [Desulfobulbaceae bacterium]
MVFPLRIFPFLVVVFLPMLFACSDAEMKKGEHFDRGMNYVQQEKYNEAIIEFRNVVQLDPGHAEARYQLGLAYIETGDLRRAFQEIREAARLDPLNYDAQLKTAEFFFLDDNYEDSLAYLDAILAGQ